MRLNEEIDDLIKNRHVACRGYFDNVLYTPSKRIAEKFIHTTLFDVRTGCLKNISDGLNFITQTWRLSKCDYPNVIIQMPFIDGTGLSMK